MAMDPNAKPLNDLRQNPQASLHLLIWLTRGRRGSLGRKGDQVLVKDPPVKHGWEIPANIPRTIAINHGMIGRESSRPWLSTRYTEILRIHREQSVTRNHDAIYYSMILVVSVMLVQCLYPRWQSRLSHMFAHVQITIQHESRPNQTCFVDPTVILSPQ